MVHLGSGARRLFAEPPGWDLAGGAQPRASRGSAGPCSQLMGAERGRCQQRVMGRLGAGDRVLCWKGFVSY